MYGRSWGCCQGVFWWGDRGKEGEILWGDLEEDDLMDIAARIIEGDCILGAFD